MQQIASGYGLIEGPVWDADRGLYFSDVREGEVNLLGRDGTITQVLPRRRGVGGMALHASGGWQSAGATSLTRRSMEPVARCCCQPRPAAASASTT
ncbi:MAG TPA: hypothetical protein VE309_05760 [Caulobacteraceae bacterium]|nr:hypothetical protein [Caulobacteraceae bacterium]